MNALFYDTEILWPSLTVNSGTADASTLKPGDYSAFKVSFFNFSGKLELPDHYTLVAGGQLE